MKNLVILLTCVLTWFCFGYAIAFGTNINATDIQFGGFYHGWFGDFSGGLKLHPTLTTADNSKELFNMQSFATKLGPILYKDTCDVRTVAAPVDDGTTTLAAGEPTNHLVTQETLDAAFLFNQRRFFVFLCFIVLSSNIATSTIAERCNFMPLIYFVFLQHFLIIPLSLCWAFARPLFPVNGS